MPLISLAAAEDVTQRNVNPWIIRPSATSAQTRTRWRTTPPRS